MAKLNEMCLKILEVMKEHPDGITEGEIREILQIPPADQANFGRRRRELHALYTIEKKREGARTLYFYKGERKSQRIRRRSTCGSGLRRFMPLAVVAVDVAGPSRSTESCW